MIWHYENPRHVELSNREQQLLGMSEAFPEKEVLSEALFKQRKAGWRAEKAARLAAHIMVCEMATELPSAFDAQNIMDEVYDMAPLKRPGVIVGDNLQDAKFVYTHHEAELLGLPERYADDGKPCGGELSLTDVMPDGADSLWYYRDELRETRNNTNNSLNDGLSAVGSAFTGQDAMAQFRLDMDARIDCANEAIEYIAQWYNMHCL